MAASISGIDHVAITVSDLDATCAFYQRVLDAEILYDHQVDGRSAVRGIKIGGVVFNIHQAGNGIELVAKRPTPGSADVCLRWGGEIADAEAMLAAHWVTVREGPVPRVSADGRPGQSVYFLDPDGNLVELLAEDPTGATRT